MEFVDVYVNRRAMGHTYMQDDRLQRMITRRGEPRARDDREIACAHGRIGVGFAHRRSRDEHWPIAYCLDCLAILAGRDPLVRDKQPRWKFSEQNLVVARWTRDWPKRGRPRYDTPPAETAWPDAA